MKKIFIFLFLVCCLNGFSQNNYCNTALPFACGTLYSYPAGTNTGAAETGPNYGCLLSQPNPAWYYMQVDTSGPINIHISTTPSQDVDFVCWGPFTSPSAPCTNGLTAACSSCPSNTNNTSFYPSGNLIDCSYSTSWQEDCHIPNAITGQWYIFMITNYSNMACNINFEQTNSTVLNHGSTNLAIITQTNFIKPNKRSNIRIYPNPFVESTTLKFDNPDKKPYTVFVYTLTGNLIRSYNNIISDVLTIEKGDLNSGVYTIELVGESSKSEMMIVK